MESPGYVQLSNPLLLSAVPALAYALAYLDRLGEAYARHIPLDWISVSLTDALSRTALVILVLTLTAAIARASTSWKQRAPQWMHESLANVAEQSTAVILFGVIIGDWRMALAVFLASILWSLGFAIRDYRKLRGRAASKQSDKTTATPGVLIGFGDNGELQVKASAVIRLLVIAIVLASYGGWARAAMQDEALITRDQDSIVAASYSGYAVLADLAITEDGEWVAGAERTITSLDGDSATFVRVRPPSRVRWTANKRFEPTP